MAEVRFCEPSCEAGDLMTNAAIEDARLTTVGDGELAITFLDQTGTVRISPTTRIEIQAPGSMDDIVPGATVIGFVNPQGVSATVWVYMS
jgi:hypothetical protein